MSETDYDLSETDCKPEPEWEEIGPDTYALKVAGGQLVLHERWIGVEDSSGLYENKCLGESMVFVPDVAQCKHGWRGLCMICLREALIAGIWNARPQSR